MFITTLKLDLGASEYSGKGTGREESEPKTERNKGTHK